MINMTVCSEMILTHLLLFISDDGYIPATPVQPFTSDYLPMQRKPALR